MKKHLPLLLCAWMFGGCAAGVVAGAAGGFAAIRHAKNQQERTFQAPLRRTYDAALVALPELGYSIEGSSLGPSEAQVAAGKARVAMASFPDGKTNVAVSVGTFEGADNRRRAGLILERIGARLGAP